jgi:hypothetical protein
MSCTSVRAAYRQWSNAPKEDAALAHAAYNAALDREDAAARVYLRTIEQRPTEIHSPIGTQRHVADAHRHRDPSL